MSSEGKLTTIGETLRATAKRFPERTWLTDGQEAMTFAEGDAKVDAVAEALLGMGIRRGDRIALWLPNVPEWVIVAVACVRLGVLVVTVNTRNKASETHHVLSKSRAKLLVMVDHYYGIDYRALLEDARRQPLPDLAEVVVLTSTLPAFGLYEALAARRVAPEARRQAESEVEIGDPAFAVFTSGTTGYPKGAVHSHIIQENCANITRWLHIESGDRILGHMPLYHIAGLCGGLLPSVMLGCTLLTVAHWQPAVVARLIAEHDVNVFGGIPTHFIDIADAIEQHGLDTSCLKSAWIGGATVTPEIARRAKSVTGLTSLQAVYGMTETTAATTYSRFEDPIEIVCENKGMPIGNFEVAVVDPETGAPRETGSDGEIRVRGHLVMMGYLDDAEETAKVMTEDGWFKTGDLGRFDGAGYLTITGRLKDMFIVGGTNAYPAEIERFLQAIPGVRQAVVVGVPERRLGEVGFAFIQRADGSNVTKEQIFQRARETLADYKVPRHIQFVEAFPMTSTNKIQRHVLAKEATAMTKGANG